MHIRRSLLRSLLLLLLLLRAPPAVGENGTASYYGQWMECYGKGSSQFPESNLFSAVADRLWDVGRRAAGSIELWCISNVQYGPGACKPGASNIRVKAVDYALSVESSAAAPRQSVTDAEL